MSLLDNLPARVTVYEVGPRDGLQNRSDSIPTATKRRFIELLAEARLPFIEVTSFVRPGSIPQLADAQEVASALTRQNGVRYTALVPNERGMERVRDGLLDGIAVFTAASETFSQRNTNASIAETLERFTPVISVAQQRGMWTRAYVSTAFGCPFEGDVPVSAVRKVTEQLLNLGINEISISDTIGVAVPSDVVRVVGSLGDLIEPSRLALHFHDTRGTALANVLAGLQLGVHVFDSSAGGLGGCPYAPGAAGNLATEDLLYMLAGLGIETGVSLDRVVAASRYLSDASGKPPSSRYYEAATA
jgi:isopropylmalate/homocitrate/citramalate synthase